MVTNAVWTENIHLDSLHLILLLLWFEGELDEKLLKLFIAEVYAELFKTEEKSTSNHTHMVNINPSKHISI